MALFSGITSLISKLRREPGVNADVDWNEIESQLIQSDLGPKLSSEIVELLKKNSKVSLEEGFLELLGNERDRNLVRNQSPNVILIVGVNGVGKTTTVGKLAHYLVATGNNVVIGAADTFRAAATGQVSTWAVDAGATLVSGKDGADPNIGLISATSSSSPYAMFISFFTRRIRSGMPRCSSQQSSSMMLLRFS